MGWVFKGENTFLESIGRGSGLRGKRLWDSRVDGMQLGEMNERKEQRMGGRMKKEVEKEGTNEARRKEK